METLTTSILYLLVDNQQYFLDLRQIKTNENEKSTKSSGQNCPFLELLCLCDIA